MSFRPKERVLSALRKIFHRTSTTNRRDANNGASGNASKSPARKSRRLVYINIDNLSA